MRAMRQYTSLLPLALLALGGCAEMYQGPRVVTLSETRFDIRYVPAVENREQIHELATWVCEQLGGETRLQMPHQYLPLDLRTSTYECVPVAPTLVSGPLEAQKG
jgi:hypothetical protein